MTETNKLKEKVNTVSTTSPTVEVSTNQQQQEVESKELLTLLGEKIIQGKITYWSNFLYLGKGLIAESEIILNLNNGSIGRSKKQLTTLQGYTTSQINQALKADNPYPAR